MFEELTGSLAIVLLMLVINAGFAIFVTALITWIWGTERIVAAAPVMSKAPYPSLRKTA